MPAAAGGTKWAGVQTLRVLVVLDMEGICGITGHRQCFPGFAADYAAGQEQITADVNALGAALLAAGAAEVHVFDSHAYLRNVLRDAVIPGVTVHDPFYVWHRLTRRVPAGCVFLCGMHAHAGAPGFMSHTILPRLRLRVDGAVVGESPWVMWALAGLPVLGASGDDGYAASVREQLPDLPVTVVKQGLSRTRAAGDAAGGRRELAEAAAAALRRVDRAPRMSAPRDFTLELSCISPDAAAAVAAEVGGQRTGDRVVAVQLGDWGQAVNFIGRAVAPYRRHAGLTADEWFGATEPEWED